MEHKQANIHYIHSLSQSAREQLVGAFFIIALLIIGSLIIAKTYSAKLFDETITYHAYMQNAQGISTETLINVSGIEVGKVSAIDIAADNKIHIQFFIYKSFEQLIRTDSTGELSKLSLVGNSTIIINAGSPALPLLADGSTLNIEEPITTNDLIEGIRPVINNLESTMSNLAKIIAVIEPSTVAETSQRLNNILENIEHITQYVSSGQGMLGKAIYDPQQAKNVTDALKKFNIALVKIEQRVNDTEPLIKDLTQLSIESRAMILELRSSLYKVDKELVHLPSIVNDTQILIKSTQETVKGAQQIWPFSATIRQPDKALLLKDEALHD
jgi:phospholipid/cholesterol/gamma-HCH transport system substrate-binding protein